MAIGNLHLVRNRTRRAAKPLNRPGAPPQRDAGRWQDLLVVRASHRRSECSDIVTKVAIGVVGQCLEQRSEIVARQVRMEDEDRSLLADALPERADCRSHWRK